MGTHIILIGFMGAGKTTVGRCLSRQTSWPLFDTDQMIEKRAGMSISRIFEARGEEVFRGLETETIHSLGDREEDWVLSAGGGMPLREENRKLLREAGQVVYLKVNPGTVLHRLQGDTTRPLLAGGDVKKKVEDLLNCRGPIYESAAHIIIKADDRQPEDIAEEIMVAVRAHLL